MPFYGSGFISATLLMSENLCSVFMTSVLLNYTCKRLIFFIHTLQNKQ